MEVKTARICFTLGMERKGKGRILFGGIGETSFDVFDLPKKEREQIVSIINKVVEQSKAGA